MVDARRAGVERVVLHGHAIEQFHAACGGLWDKSRGEIFPEGITEIAGTSIGILPKECFSDARLGVAGGFAFDYIGRVA